MPSGLVTAGLVTATLVTAAFVTAALVPVLVAPAGAAAAGGAPVAGRAPVAAFASQPRPGGTLSLVSQTSWVPPGGTFRLQVDVVGIDRPDAVAVAVAVHQAVTSRSQFGQTLDGRMLGTELHRAPLTPLGDMELDDAGNIALTLALGGPAGVDRLPLNRAGVYPVRVELRDVGTGAAIDGFTTHLVRGRDDDAPPLAVAWVQPVAAPPALRPDGTVEIGEEATEELATIIGALRSGNAPLTGVPRPETLDALRVVEPDLLTALAGTLEQRQAVAGPYVDVDPGALVAAGLGQELAAQRLRGAQVVESTLGARAGGQAGARTWVSDRVIGPDALAALDGVDRLVVPEEALEPLDRSLTLANPFLVQAPGGRRIQAAAVDSGFDAHFAAAGADPVLAAHQLLADLAVVAYDSPGLVRGVVVRPPSGWAPSGPFLTTALEALDSPLGPAVVRPVTLDQLFEEVPIDEATGTQLVRDLQPTAGRASALPAAELAAARADLDSFAAMAGVGAPEVELLQRLLLVAQAAPLAAPEHRAYLDGVARGLAELLARVGILSSGSFRLTSREATIPLTLENRLAGDIQVSLGLESDKLDFADATEHEAVGTATIPLVLHPGSTPVMVPVQARASGDFPLLITVRSPDGRLDVASARLRVRSTFPSGVGIVLSAGAGLFLCGWWARHWRTTRRDRRLIPPAE